MAGTIDEVPWWLDVNGERAATGTVLPVSLEPFFAGRLVTDGVIRGREDLLSLDVARIAPDVLAVRALVPLARARSATEERRHRATHGCGALYLATCAPRMDHSFVEPPDPARFAELFRTLFDEADRRYDGGVHAAALSDG
ncbi:MAG: formate dehydrogenase accessory sulfurtransferase FdhD, partial [Longimicrobiales bacterium]